VLHAEHGVGGFALSQLSSSKVADFRDRLRSSGVSVQTTRKILGTLSRILAYLQDSVQRTPGRPGYGASQDAAELGRV
jgi:hypothetical protein